MERNTELPIREDLRRKDFKQFGRNKLRLLSGAAERDIDRRRSISQNSE
jgi:hypothetical protein